MTREALIDHVPLPPANIGSSPGFRSGCVSCALALWTSETGLDRWSQPNACHIGYAHLDVAGQPAGLGAATHQST